VKLAEIIQQLQTRIIELEDQAYKVFEEIDRQDSQLDQVVAIVEQCMEGPITK
jgi:hypothetical protein